MLDMKKMCRVSALVCSCHHRIEKKDRAKRKKHALGKEAQFACMLCVQNIFIRD